MRLHIFTRADGSLLFAAEKDETDGTPGQQARGLDRARGFHHQSGIASVVERPAAQFPGIEMRAEDDHFVGLFVAPNFADYVLLLDGAAGFIGHLEVHAHLCWIRRNGPGQAHGVFACKYRLGDLVDLAVQRIRMAIEKKPLARAHPKDGRCASLDGPVERGAAAILWMGARERLLLYRHTN